MWAHSVSHSFFVAERGSFHRATLPSFHCQIFLTKPFRIPLTILNNFFPTRAPPLFLLSLSYSASACGNAMCHLRHSMAKACFALYHIPRFRFALIVEKHYEINYALINLILSQFLNNGSVESWKLRGIDYIYTVHLVKRILLSRICVH